MLELDPTRATWVERSEGRAPRNALATLEPAFQTGFPADYFAQLPDAGGDLPLAPTLAAVARGYATLSRSRGAVITSQPAAARPVRAPAQQSIDRRTHSNYRITFTGEAIVMPWSDQRAYLLIVNVGANDIFIAFDKSADATSVPLRSPDGFIEFERGTVSEVRAFVAGGGTGILVATEGLHYPALARGT